MRLPARDDIELTAAVRRYVTPGTGRLRRYLELLASEVGYAGQGYCLALARFATDADADLLASYLDGLNDQPGLATTTRSAPKRQGS